MSMRTLIVGGGIAGLSLASFLKQRGLEPVIVEQAEKWSRIGYGISLWGNGIKILQTLDLGEKFLSEGAQIEEWTLRNQQGEVLSNIQLEYGQSPP